LSDSEGKISLYFVPRQNAFVGFFDEAELERGVVSYLSEGLSTTISN
jgi:hypothetical protein